MLPPRVRGTVSIHDDERRHASGGVLGMAGLIDGREVRCRSERLPVSTLILTNAAPSEIEIWMVIMAIRVTSVAHEIFPSRPLLVCLENARC